MWWSRFLFGAVKFDDNEEYAAFQFKFLCVVMLTGGLLTAVFLATAHAGVNPMDARHLWSMAVFTTTALVLWLLLGNPCLTAPYSVHALITATLSLMYFALFFHVYGNRSLSYFARMQSYNRRLQALATRDGLTGVLNARAYHEACTKLLAHARRDHSPSAVLFIDLDHFKRINDQHGHLAGDRVLQAVAQCVQQHLRASDVLGRIGGEEFCVFLPHTDVAGAAQVAEKLRSRIEALMPETAPTTQLRVTASIGVTSVGPDDESLQTIQHRADEAMYQAKQQGRNRVSVL